MVFSTAMGQLTSFGLGGPEDKQGTRDKNYYWGCYDSPFMVPNPFDPSQKLDCSFLATQTGAPFCAESIAQTHCPETCDACSIASTKDSETPFFYKGKKAITCNDVRKMPFYEFFMACNDFGMTNTCRETCELTSQAVQNTYKFTMDGTSDYWKMKWTDLTTFHATGYEPYTSEGKLFGESGYAQGTISEPRVGWNSGKQRPIIVECPGGYFNFKQVIFTKAWDKDSQGNLIRSQDMFVEAWRHDEITGSFRKTWGDGDQKNPFRLWAYPTSSGWNNITKMTFKTVQITSSGNITRYFAIDDFEVHITKPCNVDMSDTSAGIKEGVPPGFA